MRHNVKTSLWTALSLAAMAWPALAAGPEALEASVEDLATAGVPAVVAVAPAGDRFAPPVKYFRSAEALSEADARKDCGDCGDLIAVYAAEAPSVPGWHAEKSQQFVKIGGRLQLRAYIPSAKRIVTVTAVDERTLRKISETLVRKFSQ